MKLVVIVKEGVWGGRKKEDAARDAEDLGRWLSEITREDPHTHNKEPVARIEVVETVQDATERVRREGVDVVIFNSRSMLDAARALKKERHRLRVVVLTGLIPEDEVVIVDRRWPRNLEDMGRVLLDLA